MESIIVQERIPWACALVRALPDAGRPPLWGRVPADREAAALAAIAEWRWDGEDALAAAGLCGECWLAGCGCDGEPPVIPSGKGA